MLQGLTPWELVLIVGLGAVIVGPKEVPAAARVVGRVCGSIVRLSAEARQYFDKAIQDTDVADLRREIAASVGTIRSLRWGVEWVRRRRAIELACCTLFSSFFILRVQVRGSVHRVSNGRWEQWPSRKSNKAGISKLSCR